MTTETILIRVREDGSRVVKRNLQEVGGAAESAAGFVRSLGGVLAALAAGGVLGGLLRLADTFTTMQNKLRLVTTGTENLNKVTRELLTISNATRTDFESTAELYARVAGATKEMGLSQKETLAFTKSLNQAVVLSGASAQEAAGGIRQLSQGLASGALRGDELNSVMENFPKVADVIAESLGVSRGELRKLGAEGKITADIIIDAFAQASGRLEADFATTVTTVSQAFTVFKNNLLAFVGDADKALGVTKFIAESVLVIGNNLNVILPVLVGMATGIATAFAPAVIAIFKAQLVGLFALIAANPIGAVVIAVVAVTTALFAMRDQLKLSSDSAATLGDLMTAAWEMIGPAISAAAQLAGEFFKWLSDTSGGTFSSMIDDINGYENANESVWFKLARTTAMVFDMIGGVIRGTFQGLQAVATKVIDTVIKSFGLMGEAFEAAMNFDVEALRGISAEGNTLLIEAGTNLGTVFGAAFSDAQLSQADSGLEALLDKMKARAEEIAKIREGAGNQPFAPGAPPGAPPTVVDPQAAKELERLRDALRGLQDAAFPVGAVMRQLNEAQATLAASVAAGLIPLAEAEMIYERLHESLKAQLDPLGALNEELDQNIRWLKMGSAQREIDITLYQMVTRLQQDGVRLTREETDALRAKLVVEQELDRISRARDSIEQGSSKMQMRDAGDSLAAMEQLKELTGGDKFNVLNSLLGGTLDETQAAFDAQIEQFSNYYAIIEQFRQQDVANEEIASQAKRAIKQQEMDMYLSRTSDALGAAAGLMKSNSKEAFRIGQAAAIGQAIVNTYTAATAAYQSAAAIPYVGWILGPAAAAGAIAAGMAQVSAIRSQQMPAYRTGGTYTIGGSGGIDSQVVSMRGTPGEQISINTPSQANAMQNIESLLREDRAAGRGRGGVTQNLTIVQQGKPDRTTPYQIARLTRRETTKEFMRS